jgi:glycosyltransferase involved in cell wall biosynthesis
MIQYPKISIVIPTYNQEKYILQAINSALAIDYPNKEIIVSDDCSTDNTKLVVESLEEFSKIKYYINDSNVGRVKNYNKCLYERVTGDWMINLDGDDYFTNTDFLKKSIHSFINIQSNNSNIVLMGLKKINSQVQAKYKNNVNHGCFLINGKDVFLDWQNLCIEHFAAIIHTKTARNIGFYTKDIISSDWESILRLVLLGDVMLFNNAIATWRLTGDNASQDYNFKKRIDNLSFILNPAKYALSLGLEQEKVDLWKNNMLAQQIKGMIYKSSCIDFIKLFKYIQSNHPNLKYLFFSPLIMGNKLLHSFGLKGK